MRCRYCGKEVALLKRLTGSGGFCSEAHKQSYQDEYNQLALGRLLQAQQKGHTQPPGKAKGSTVAVEAVPAEEAGLKEQSVQMPALPLEISNLEESVAGERPSRDALAGAPPAPDGPAEASPKPDAEPLGIANFLTDSPTAATVPEETTHVEPWLDFTSGPAVADWRSRPGPPALSTAEAVSLDLLPSAAPAGSTAIPANLTPQEFVNGLGLPTPLRKVSATHELPSAGPMTIEVPASSIDFAPDPSIAMEVGLETAVSVEDSELLELPFTGIEFPTEDSGVVVVVRQESRATDAVEPVEDDTPRASLEALARLHQDLVQQETASLREPGVTVAGPAAAEGDPHPETPRHPETPSPGRATELLDIQIRMFPPAKPVPREGAGLPIESELLLPRLKSLPLRPKMAVAHGYERTSTSPTQAQGTAAAQTIPPSTPAPAARPVSRIIQAPPLPAPARAEPSKLAPRIKPAAQAPASQAVVVEPENGASIHAAEKPAAKAEPVVEEIAIPAAQQTPIQPVSRRPGEPAPRNAPNFAAVQLPKPTFLGSLKVKLGIAISLLVVACSTWLGWGGKSFTSHGSNPTTSADGPGPSKGMEGGGWIENWGAGPSDPRADSQITIYRPSLKLSDYRIEFQASIDTKSIGWVFRAADPDNYYAMKLMDVSDGPAPKVAVFKYVVLNGRQTQVGRVPIDQAVQADTVFNIRTDVRGSQFSTYIQGRLADVWTSDQFKAGGAGFLNEGEERGKVKSVSIHSLNGVGR
jgi:hypothetical protein